MNLPGYEWLREEWARPEGVAKLAKVRALAALAKGAGLPIHHLALLWCLSNPHVSTVILGASKVAQLHDNLGALTNKAKMTPDVLAEIEKIMANKPAAAARY